MADLTITAASVAVTDLRGTLVRKAGEAIAAGKAVYLNGATDLLMLADSNSATVEAHAAGGIALNGAATGQPVVVAREGAITIGATLTPGASYFLSDTPGGICPQADVGTGENVCLIGIARSASVLQLAIRNLGVTL